MPDNPQLIRGLTLVAATSIVVGNVIGTGVFLKARVMTCNVGTPWMVLMVYSAAGLLSLAGALTYAELAAMMPRSGGEYVYLREAYGRRWAFLFGWMTFFIGKAGSQAALAIGFAIFLNILLGGALEGKYFDLAPWGYEIPFGSLQVVALAAIAMVTLVNCAAVRVSGGVASFLSAIKVVLVFLVGLGAFLLAKGADWSHLTMTGVHGACEGVDASARMGVGGFGAAMLGALWAYDGWNSVTLCAGEVENPQRNLPLALIGGMLIVTGLYLFVNLGYFYALSPLEIANISRQSSVATEVARTFLGPLAVGLMAAALISSIFGTLHASILTGARVPHAMAQDQLFFEKLSRVSSRSHVPIAALVVQAVWASLLTLSGSFDALTDYAIFGLWIFYAFAASSIFRLRKQLPDAERPYRIWGYPFIPLLFVLTSAFLLLNTVLARPKQACIGLGLILLGLPFYAFWNRRRTSTDYTDSTD